MSPDEMRILIIVTSHDRLGDTGRKTGLWLEELTDPYYAFKDAGARLVIASPKGGQPPIDPKSEEPAHAGQGTVARFKKDAEAQAALAHSRRLDEIDARDFDAVFYPGGHGPMWDLARDRPSAALIKAFHAAGKPLGLVCHGPAALLPVVGDDGRPFVANQKLTAFTNSEEELFGTAGVMPFLLEDALRRLGAHFSRGADRQPYVVRDGLLITGQNPSSARGVAAALLETISGPHRGAAAGVAAPPP
jgi:putative intracellular protease/amidase